MLPGGIHTQRSLLQRRKSLTTTFQALIDGLIVLGTMYYAFYYTQGFFTTTDAVLDGPLDVVLGHVGALGLVDD